jgi:NTP pyrophosphatase (non-canonical NTP hydrolase)
MEIKELKEFAKESEDKLSRYYNKTKEELIVFHALKIGEETGELFEQVLNHHNIQRKEKALDKDKIGEEIADVLLAGIVLAQSLNIDIEKELDDKMKKNRERIK